MTIDQLIERLEEYRDLIGGDACLPFVHPPNGRDPNGEVHSAPPIQLKK